MFSFPQLPVLFPMPSSDIPYRWLSWYKRRCYATHTHTHTHGNGIEFFRLSPCFTPPSTIHELQPTPYISKAVGISVKYLGSASQCWMLHTYALLLSWHRTVRFDWPPLLTSGRWCLQRAMTVAVLEWCIPWLSMTYWSIASYIN